MKTSARRGSADTAEAPTGDAGAPDSATPPAPTEPPAKPAADTLVEDAVALARTWIGTATGADAGTAGPAASKTDKAVARASAALGQLVSDPAGLELAVGFVDDVARPQDTQIAAKALARLGKKAGSATFLSASDRALFRAGALTAPVLPGIVVPAARARLRQLVGHLVADAGNGLTAHLARTRAEGYTLNVNLLGEAVLGKDEAAARLARTVALVERPDVDYVSVKVSSVAAQLVTWDLDGSRDRVVEQLLPLYRSARDHGVFLNLDMEEYRDLALTTAVFTDILGRDEFRDLEAGIVLQAYLPDALGALDGLTEFAAKRVANGGARIKVRIVKGANLAMEHVEATLHDWAQAPYATKPDVDANYVRMLDHALRPERAHAVRIGAASHNLFHVALAILLGRARGVSEALDIEMLQGMAPAEAAAVRDEVAKDHGHVVLYTPVVRDEDFDVAISYLVRRLEENATEQNFLHAAFAPSRVEPVETQVSTSSTSGGSAMDRQEAAFRASVELGVHYAPDDVAPRRRPRPAPAQVTGAFHNAADTDPAVEAHRTWAQQVTSTRSGYVPALAEPLATSAQVDDVVALARRAGTAWAKVAPADRGRVLRAAAQHLEAARTDLVAAMVHEAGKTVAEADPEVSEAVDFAAYYAQAAEALDPASEAWPGARYTPDGVTLVTPPWNFPVAIPIGGVLAGLASGSSVIAKPAPPTPRCLEIAVEAVHAALDEVAPEIGLDPAIARDVAQFVRVPDGDLGRRLVTHDGVSRVILTGAIETAEMFASWRPDLPVLAETSGKNAIVVTPSADLDLAVADVVRSAFGHAGQKCSAASLVILVGSVGDPRTATGERFRRQLVDAVASLAVGPATDLATVMGPLTEPAGGKLLRALTTLEQGESWLVRPRRLDAVAQEAGLGKGRLWTPGVRDGVRPGSFFHLTEAFGPVLGIMTARTLDEALDLQNAVSFGLTGGIHSLDDAEVEHWLDRVEVGNAYVNRHITGAIVQRQSFGGWKASVVGSGAKAGGPNYVAQLGRWADAPDVPSRTEDPAGWLAWARADDARAWLTEFSGEHDPSALGVESNVFRYRAVPGLTVRVGAGAADVEVQRVLAAAARAGVDVTVVGQESTDEAFAESVADGLVTGRIRVVGEAPGLRDAAASRLGSVTVLDGPVLASGRRELLTMLREQAVSRTMHRYGHQRTA
ncbi:proline dehydrogenase family protein [Promicromonospora sukumoe]|uniref:L-glutamate gamma-semialdehyde dehydrogenase n=1 Tax=Promicromonospora sukumoe TaxID=88382 RepID=A0A7W3PFS2_9MICO|nr:bifunctional proline dehydrogenase/L-glutamate gamma-semialdehyde dehydrogenase [Promicromonospora sukumoe]MBA8810056.1 RHH-type proline utilization regulon transcriptional repressor/proline dehydrogenase/delta 1-pyrroline-5-carboxylate dehydrogenase [Promicromonospora sukumoe]